MGDGFLEVVRARDISVGGLAICVPNEFRGCNIDEPVHLVVKLGAEKAFTARGVIRHLSKEAGAHFFGVQFTTIGPDVVERIGRYVARRLAEGA